MILNIIPAGPNRTINICVTLKKEKKTRVWKIHVSNKLVFNLTLNTVINNNVIIAKITDTTILITCLEKNIDHFPCVFLILLQQY